MKTYHIPLIIICVVLFGAALNACIPPTATTSPIKTPTLTELPAATQGPAAFLPVAWRCNCDCATATPTPTPLPSVTVEIVDCAGQITDTHWLTSTFGDVRWSEGSLSELRCSIGPSVIVAHVVDINGQPVQNATVVLHWQDAPMLPLELRLCGLDRGVYGPTNENGDIGFGLGAGSYYWPPAGGPHVLWVVGGESCLAGIGMIAETEHQTLWPTWVLSAGKVSDVGKDWGFSEGALLYQQTIDGREMWVIQAP